MIICSICKNLDGNETFVARETMYGHGDEFEYIECARCGCLQIAETPTNLSKFYPKNYYSFDAIAEEGRLKQFFIRKRTRYLAGHENLIGRLYNGRRPAPLLPVWLNGTDVDFEAKILDVGCGSGAELMQLSYSGFSKLTGIDPFIERDIRYRNGVCIMRRALEEMGGIYDFIMLHHSLEHMTDQYSTFEHLDRLLHPQGQLLVRIPVAGNLIWRKYGADWTQLDAPRHLHLHTELSLKLLAERTGFVVKRVVYDSTGFQFWGSEQVKRGLPLVDEVTGEIGPRPGLFTDAALKAFEEEALTLNEAGQGDQACFYLSRS